MNSSIIGCTKNNGVSTAKITLTLVLEHENNGRIAHENNGRTARTRK